jgi:hypothetical protein
VIVGHAKDVARRWVLEEARDLPGFVGAFHHGSTAWLSDDAVLPVTSDVDVMLVGAESQQGGGSDTFVYRGVLLQVSAMPVSRCRSPERVLSDYHLAGSFRTPNIIVDPSGRLTEVQSAVAEHYAERRWVRARCEHARNNVLRYLRSVDEADSLHGRAIAWLFAAGVTTHVLLVAGLKNPTVRRRYLATSNLLAEYGHSDLYESLLELIGCARISRAQAEHHLAALADAFDAAVSAIRSDLPFASEISAAARPLAIDGSRDLIESGHHREAIFWIAVTYSRVQTVLRQDATAETRDRFDPGYRNLLADLGIRSFADLQQRARRIEQRLPEVWQTAEAIIAANPDVEE